MRGDQRQMREQHPLPLQRPPALADETAFETGICGLRLAALEQQKRMTRFWIPAECVSLLVRTQSRIAVTDRGLNVAAHTTGVAEGPRRIVCKVDQRIIDVRQRLLQRATNSQDLGTVQLARAGETHAA